MKGQSDHLTQMHPREILGRCTANIMAIFLDILLLKLIAWVGFPRQQLGNPLVNSRIYAIAAFKSLRGLYLKKDLTV